MRKMIMLALILLTFGYANNAFCLDLQSQVNLLKYEINKWDNIKDEKESELLKPVIEANINYLIDSICLKIKKYEVKLEKIKKQIQDCGAYSEDDEGSERNLSEKYWKKFYSTQNKIESLKDLLSVIDQLKIKLI